MLRSRRGLRVRPGSIVSTVSRISTTCDVVAFCSSSGHCQLDCAYCIVVPVIKRNPSLTLEDLDYFLGAVGKRTFFIFSGKGDFFAGYARRDRLLEHLLERYVEVALDVNGVLLNEYPELSREKLDRIRAVNLTLHYKQIVDKRVTAAWAENARTLLSLHRGEMILGTILSPLSRESWGESLDFYRREIFEKTGQRIWLIKDCDRPMSPEETADVAALEARHGDMVEKTHRDDFSGAFAGREQVLCPAGAEYFRVWNDGRVEGCPYVEALGGLGNLKERTFSPRKGPFACSTPRFCDCYDLLQLGKMRDASGAPLALTPPPRG